MLREWLQREELVSCPVGVVVVLAKPVVVVSVGHCLAAFPQVCIVGSLLIPLVRGIVISFIAACFLKVIHTNSAVLRTVALFSTSVASLRWCFAFVVRPSFSFELLLMPSKAFLGQFVLSLFLPCMTYNLCC